MVNLTLLVQMVHFGIAYYILDLLVLRIAVRQVQQEEHVITQLQQDIQQLGHEIDRKKEGQVQEWQHMQQLLVQQKPEVKLTSLLTIGQPASQAGVSLTKQEIAQQAHEMKQLIIEKVLHD